MRKNECAGINKSNVKWSEAGVNGGFRMGGSSDEDDEEGQDNKAV